MMFIATLTSLLPFTKGDHSVIPRIKLSNILGNTYKTFQEIFFFPNHTPFLSIVSTPSSLPAFQPLKVLANYFQKENYFQESHWFTVNLISEYYGDVT